MLRVVHQGKKDPSLLMAELDSAAELRGCMQVGRVAADQVARSAGLRGCMQIGRVAAEQVALAVVARNLAGEVDLAGCILLASAVVKVLVITNHPFVKHHLFPMLRLEYPTLWKCPNVLSDFD